MARDHPPNPRPWYTFKKKLGSGTYGDVSLYHDVARQRDVAVKIPSADGLEALKMEARLLKRFNHPGVVKYVDQFTSQGKLHLVMELATEGDLLRYIHKRAGAGTPLTLKEKLNIMSQICAGLKYVHGSGVGMIHRDIKPQNILVTIDSFNNPIAMLADFGVTKPVLNSLAGQHTALTGTLPYMAPEVIEGHAYDKRADVWSCGILFYGLLVGFGGGKPDAHPFGSMSKVEWAATLNNILKGTPDLSLVPCYELIGHKARTLLSLMLDRDFNARPTATQLDGIVTSLVAAMEGTSFKLETKVFAAEPSSCIIC